MRFFFIFNSADMKDAFKIAWLFYSTIIAAVLLVIFIMPGDKIVNNTPLCESISKNNTECFACGITHGFIEISELKFDSANSYNQGSIYIFLMFLLNTFAYIFYLLRNLRYTKIFFLKGNKKWVKAV